MSHSTVIVVLKNDAVEATNLDDALEKALEPFDENKDTPLYVKLTRQQAIDKEREGLLRYRDEGLYAKYLKDPAAYKEEVFDRNPQHYEYVSTEFPNILSRLDDDEFLYQRAIEWENVDEDGNITSTYNPRSKWDWWAIGGRWSNSIINTTFIEHHPEQKRSEHWTIPAWDEHGGGVDIAQKKSVRSCRSTFAFLDADGEWHERGRMGWWGMVSDEQDQAEWDARHAELVAAVDDDDWLVLVDVHI